ncbi:MAG: YIP1 family protein [Chloroflexi bacterium]|nr:YIP1 family protein [Chloroflexota bacterium]
MAVRYLDLLYQVLLHPSSAFRSASGKRTLVSALVTAVFTSVVFAFVLMPNPPQLVEAIFGLERGTLGAVPLWLIWLSLFPAGLATYAGLLHLTARVLRGKGTYVGMFCKLCLATFPLVLAASLALIRALMDSATGYVIYYAGFSVLAVWLAGLCAIAVRENYSLGVVRAVVTSVAGVCVVLLCALAASVALQHS